METVSLCCQSAHQGKCSPALSGILWLSLASLDLMVIRTKRDKKKKKIKGFSEQEKRDNDDDCSDDVIG